MAAPQQFNVRKATKSRIKARIALLGPPGSGKTYTGIEIGRGLIGPDGKLCVVDTEHRSSERYADKGFDVIELSPETVPYNTYGPQTYTNIIKFCEQQGYDCIVIDSLSHAWMGTGGALEQKEQAAKGRGKNDFNAWAEITPIQREMVETILASKCHIIATMRTKVEYAVERGTDNKTTVQKIGTKPIQRDDVEYEFDVVAEMDQSHDLRISKTRLKFLDGLVISRPGQKLGQDILADLNSGVAAPAASTPAETPAPATTTHSSNTTTEPDPAPGSADDPYENPEPRGEPYVMKPGEQKGITRKLAELGYPQAEIDKQIAACKGNPDTQALIKRIKDGKVAPYAPPAEPASAPEPAPGSGGSPQTGAEDVSGGNPHPDESSAPESPTATDDAEEPLYNPDGTPANAAAVAHQAQVDFEADDTGAAAATPLTETPEDAGDGASPQKLLADAHEYVANDAVPEELQEAITSTPLLRTKIGNECGVPLDEQAGLLEALGLKKGWNDIDDGDRLAVWWMAERIAAQYAPEQ